MAPVARLVMVSVLLLGGMTAAHVAGRQSPPAQGGSGPTPGANVDVTVTPKVVLTGQKVTIAGSTGYSEKQHQASILVRHASGAPSATLSAQVDSKRQFSVTFSDTKKSGKYVVTVTSPDGKGKGTAEFRVDSISDLAQEVEHLAIEIDKRTKQMAAFVKDTAVSLPASPERETMIAKAQQLDAKARTVDLPPLKILGLLKNLVPKSQVVNLPDVEIMGELRDWVPEAEEGIEVIDRSRIGEKPAPICETINTAIEGAKFAAYAFTITGNLLSTLGKIAVDKGVPAMVEHLGYEGAEAYASSSAIKAAAEGLHGLHEVTKSGYAIAIDGVEYLTKWLFGRYCGSFDGPLNVSMTMVWNEGIRPWLKYGVTLEGRFRLRFPKNTPPGKPVYMTGELEGNATHFSFWEDVMLIASLPKTTVVLQRVWLPPMAFANSTASPIDFGMVARAATPAYFNVPVVAEMTGETIKMQYKEARVDFSRVVQNRLLFVVITPLMPDFKVFTFPIQKGYWILSKGLNDPCILTVKRSAEGEQISYVTKNHRETSDKGVVVDWTIDVKAKKLGEGHEK